MPAPDAVPEPVGLPELEGDSLWLRVDVKLGVMDGVGVGNALRVSLALIVDVAVTDGENVSVRVCDTVGDWLCEGVPVEDTERDADCD